jgi:hypothetical protein
MFNKFGKIASALALVSLGTPVAAHQRQDAFASSAGPQDAARPLMFGGATFRLSLDGRGGGKPELALRFTGGTQSRGAGPRLGEGFALTSAPDGKARLRIAGEDSAVIGKRLNISGTQTALVAGGVLLIGGLVLLAASAGAGDAANAYWDEE